MWFTITVISGRAISINLYQCALHKANRLSAVIVINNGASSHLPRYPKLFFFLAQKWFFLIPFPCSVSMSYFLSVCGLAALKMKRRLPSSGTSTIFMLSQTTSSHSFSWTDWGLSFLAAFVASAHSLLVSHLLSSSSPTVRVHIPILKQPVCTFSLATKIFTDS